MTLLNWVHSRRNSIPDEFIGSSFGPSITPCTSRCLRATASRLRPDGRARGAFPDPHARSDERTIRGSAHQRAEPSRETGIFTVCRRSLCLAGSPRSTRVFFCA